jgi:hypothetical protein
LQAAKVFSENLLAGFIITVLNIRCHGNSLLLKVCYVPYV